eukprot:GHVU01173815.1.p1 GENE.GHVU01173815.1~~GHVU01173815.1.p1  ORF type:complete len:100 (-),score=2.36 GHVU01173815.1:206-505(-)
MAPQLCFCLQHSFTHSNVAIAHQLSRHRSQSTDRSCSAVLPFQPVSSVIAPTCVRACVYACVCAHICECMSHKAEATGTRINAKAAENQDPTFGGLQSS